MCPFKAHRLYYFWPKEGASVLHRLLGTKYAYAIVATCRHVFAVRHYPYAFSASFITPVSQYFFMFPALPSLCGLRTLYCHDGVLSTK